MKAIERRLAALEALIPEEPSGVVVTIADGEFDPAADLVVIRVVDKSVLDGLPAPDPELIEALRRDRAAWDAARLGSVESERVH
jgi:hypothetical protein